MEIQDEGPADHKEASKAAAGTSPGAAPGSEASARSWLLVLKRTEKPPEKTRPGKQNTKEHKRARAKTKEKKPEEKETQLASAASARGAHGADCLRRGLRGGHLPERGRAGPSHVVPIRVEGQPRISAVSILTWFWDYDHFNTGF